MAGAGVLRAAEKQVGSKLGNIVNKADELRNSTILTAKGSPSWTGGRNVPQNSKKAAYKEAYRRERTNGNVSGKELQGSYQKSPANIKAEQYRARQAKAAEKQTRIDASKEEIRSKYLQKQQNQVAGHEKAKEIAINRRTNQKSLDRQAQYKEEQRVKRLGMNMSQQEATGAFKGMKGNADYVAPKHQTQSQQRAAQEQGYRDRLQAKREKQASASGGSGPGAGGSGGNGPGSTKKGAAYKLTPGGDSSETLMEQVMKTGTTMRSNLGDHIKDNYGGKTSNYLMKSAGQGAVWGGAIGGTVSAAQGGDFWEGAKEGAFKGAVFNTGYKSIKHGTRSQGMGEILDNGKMIWQHHGKGGAGAGVQAQQILRSNVQNTVM